MTMDAAFFAKQMVIQRGFVELSLVDICEIKRILGVTVDQHGNTVHDARSNVQYNATNNIICRVEASRAFQNDRNKFQAITTDNFIIYLPHDIDLIETDEILYLGLTYSVRKIIYSGNMDAFTEALIYHTDKNQS